MEMSELFGEKKLGFGLMRLPLTNPKDDTSIDIELAKKMVDVFMERGFTYFDTAWMYCGFNSENAVKEILTTRYPRDSYTLATKMHVGFLKDKDDRQKMWDAQINKTGVSYFDYYLIHDQGNSHYAKAKELDLYNFLREKRDQGLIKHLGFSFHDKADVLDRILTENPDMEFVQIQLNYLDWESDNVQSRKCYEVCCKHNKPVIVMEPVKGGTLANVPDTAEKIMKNYNKDASIPSWAVRFAASHDNVKMVLSGMSNLEQMLDNISFMQDFKSLSEEEINIINRVTDILNGKIAIPCTGCSYCTDGCPKNIAIPRYFSLYNEAKTDDEKKVDFVEKYKNIKSTFGSPLDCLRCGKCEKICPQHLNIIEYLKEVKDYFED